MATNTVKTTTTTSITNVAIAIIIIVAVVVAAIVIVINQESIILKFSLKFNNLIKLFTFSQQLSTTIISISSMFKCSIYF
jgi:hypothetical protein